MTGSPCGAGRETRTRMTSTDAQISPSGEPTPKPRRRTCPPEYKLRIVAEYGAAPNGEKGAILSRERLYHSHIIEWRAGRDAGAMTSPGRQAPPRPARLRRSRPVSGS